MDLTPILNDAEAQDLLELILTGVYVEAVSLDLRKPGVAQVITLHLDDGRDITLGAASGLLWAENGLSHD